MLELALFCNTCLRRGSNHLMGEEKSFSRNCLLEFAPTSLSSPNAITSLEVKLFCQGTLKNLKGLYVVNKFRSPNNFSQFHPVINCSCIELFEEHK